jgi:membrane protein YdbS with pleckstrin-like domain
VERKGSLFTFCRKLFQDQTNCRHHHFKLVFMEETTICEVSPSQILNLKAFFFSILSMAIIVTAAILTGENLVYIALVLPVGYAFWKYLEIKSIKLKITDQRLILREGVLNKTTNETELYRVRDSSIDEPFFYRMFGCGNINIFTTDDADAVLHLKAYNKPHWVKDQVRNYSEICRQKKRWGTDNILLHDQLNQ